MSIATGTMILQQMADHTFISMDQSVYYSPAKTASSLTKMEIDFNNSKSELYKKI